MLLETHRVHKPLSWLKKSPELFIARTYMGVYVVSKEDSTYRVYLSVDWDPENDYRNEYGDNEDKRYPNDILYREELGIQKFFRLKNLPSLEEAQAACQNHARQRFFDLEAALNKYSKEEYR